MNLLDGLSLVLVGRVYRDKDYFRVRRTVYTALAWVPGSDGDAMWWAHTEAVFRQRYAERLTR